MIVLVPIKYLNACHVVTFLYLHGCHVVTFLYLHGCHVVTFLFNLALCSSRFWTYAVRVTLLNIINSFSLCLLRHSADPPMTSELTERELPLQIVTIHKNCFRVHGLYSLLRSRLSGCHATLPRKELPGGSVA